MKHATSRFVQRAGEYARCGAACLLAAMLLAAATTTPAGPVVGMPGVRTLAVNIYIGAGIERVAALDPTAPGYITNLIATVTGVYYEILASQPQARVERVAEEIASRMPEIVAVEEGTLLRNQSPGDLAFRGTIPATNIVFDYVQMLVDSLEARGAHYAVASVSDEWDVEMPMLNLQTGTLDDVRQTDRDAILVRTDLPRGEFRVSHPRSGHFTNVIFFPSIGLSMTRGWCSVDVLHRGRAFRYICTHPEEETVPQLQVLQVQELLAGPAKTCLPVLLCGDFNADPLHRDGSLAYDTVIDGGFKDAWAIVHPDDPAGGLTWGHDEFLADPTQLFDRRIDFVFYRGSAFVPVEADAIDMTLDRVQPPLWASDHAAISAELRMGRARAANIGSGFGGTRH